MNGENKITFQSFTERVAQRAKVSNSEADTYIHQLAKTTGDTLESGGEVQLYHFGRFHTAHVDERPGHNPQTGAALTIPGHTRVEFRPYKALLLAVNWPFRNLRTRVLPADKLRTKALPTDKAGSESHAITWLLLALILLGLIMLGMGIKNWISDRNTVTSSPAELPARIESERPALQAATIGTAAVTDTAGDAATASTPAAVTNTTNFVVAPGNTLWGIAASQWGDSSWWPVIYTENRAELPSHNPDLIEVGITLRIPVLAGSAAQPTDADLRQKRNSYRIVAEDYTQLEHPRAEEYTAIAALGLPRQ